MDDSEFSIELIAGADGFGSGEHPTTQLAMQLLYALAATRDCANILDIGCGSGLLALTAAHLWSNARITAADIQACAVDTTRRNVKHNGLVERIHAVRSDGYRHPDIQQRAPYDLVICNMTADPIVQLATSLDKVLAAGGVVVLSGVLTWRSEEVLALHAQLGIMPLLAPLYSDTWEAHLLAKPDAE